MSAPKFELLMNFQIEGSFPPHELGITSRGRRRFVNVTGGTFEGPKLRGIILPGGEDRALVRADGVFEINAQCIAQTHDGAKILVTYQGIWDMPASVLEPMLRREIKVDPSQYYYRTVVTFETSAQPYAWLNRILAFGLGGPAQRGSNYEIFHLL